MADLKELAEKLVNLTVKEVNELSDILKEEHGIEPAAAAAVPVASAQGGQEEAEEQTEFDVVLKEHGGKKLKVVKAVKEMLSIGLKDAKELVDSAPKTLKEQVSKEEAEALKSKLEELEAKVEIK